MIGVALAEFVGDVLVAGGHGHRGPAHDLHDDPGRDFQDEEHGRGGVPGYKREQTCRAGIYKQGTVGHTTGYGYGATGLPTTCPGSRCMAVVPSIVG